MSDADHMELAIYFIGFLISSEALRSVRSPRTRIVWRGLRLRHALPALVAIGLVGVATYVIANVAPWTQWGWWSALGGQGNVAFGNVGVSLSSTEEPKWIFRFAPFLFVAAMLCYLPSAARLEERWFRLGSERRTRLQRVAASLSFGLVHMIMGVPVSVALALGLAGWMFQRSYLSAYERRRSRHEAIMASTHVHLAYNLILVTLVALVLLLPHLR